MFRLKANWHKMICLIIILTANVKLFAQPKYQPLPEPFFQYGHNLNKISIVGNAAVIIVFKDNNFLNFTFPHNNLELAQHYSQELHKALVGTPVNPIMYLSYAELVNKESLEKSYNMMLEKEIDNLIFFEIAEVHGYEFHYFKMTAFNQDTTFYDHNQYCYTIHNDNMDLLIKRLHHDILNHSKDFELVSNDSTPNFVVLDKKIGIIKEDLPLGWEGSTFLFAKFQKAEIPDQKPRGIQKSYYHTLVKHNEEVDDQNILLNQALANTCYAHGLVNRETWRTTESDDNIMFIDYYVDRTSFGLNESDDGGNYTKASTNINFVLVDPATNSAYLLNSYKVKGDILKNYISFIQDLDRKIKTEEKITSQ